MRKYILILAVLFAGCTGGIKLPGVVKYKITSDSGQCYLYIRFAQTDGSGYTLITAWDEKYCAYEVGQEIK